MHNVGNIGIDANFEFPYISSFLLHLYHMMLVNVKIETSGKSGITFQGHRFHWTFTFLMCLLQHVSGFFLYFEGSNNCVSTILGMMSKRKFETHFRTWQRAVEMSQCHHLLKVNCG